MFRQLLKNQKHGLKDAKTSDDLSDFANAEYLIPDDEIIIDIDNLEFPKIKKMIEYLHIRTRIVETKRGVHLYFKKTNPKQKFPKSHAICNLGIVVEYKQDKVCVKQNGVVRAGFDNDYLEILPKFFMPSKKLKQSIDGLEVGERNNTLLGVWTSTINPQCVKFVNDILFAQPLEQNEVDNILQIEPKNEELSFREMANEFIDSNDIVLHRDVIYVKKNNIWTSDERIIKSIIGATYPNFLMRNINEIYQQLQLLLDNIDSDLIRDVQIENGFVHNGLFINSKYCDFTPFYVNRSYNKEAKPSDNMITFLDLLFKDSQSQALFFEIAGFAFNLDFQKRKKSSLITFLYGNGGDGKGTLITLLTQIFGVENISAAKPHDLNNPKELASLDQKLINFGEDIENKAIESELHILKNISTLDRINVSKLYEQANVKILHPQLIFTSNNLTKTFEKGKSVERRFKFFDCRNSLLEKVESGQFNQEFFDDLQSEQNKDYIFKLLIEGCERITNNNFTKSEKVEAFTKHWNELNDFTKKYILELQERDYINRKPKLVYALYCDFCEENGLNPRNQNNFKKEMIELLLLDVKLVKINNKPERVFTKKNEEENV